MLDRAAAMKQPMLHAEDEARLVDLWSRNRDMVARDTLILSHMRICYAMAARWTRNEAHVNDLAQEGFFGLLRALNKFDPNRGVRFGNYARLWIKSAVEDALGSVALSVDMSSRIYRRAKGDARNLHGDVVPWEARVAVRGEVQLDAPMGGEGSPGDSLMDMLEDGRPNPEQAAVETDRVLSLKATVDDALARSMTEREASVLRRRDLSETPETLDAIALSMGISRERVRQIQNSGLAKLRRHMLAAKFPVHLLRPEE